MKIRLAQQAYETYAAHAADPMERGPLEELLGAELQCGNAMFVRLHGNKALYLLNAYWNYTSSDQMQELLLTDCIAYFAPIRPMKSSLRRFSA